MPIDINLLRHEKGYDPEVVITSEKNRFRGTDSADKTISLDSKWRKVLFNIENLRKTINQYQKCISEHMKKSKISNSQNDLSISVQEMNAEDLGILKNKITEAFSSNDASPTLPSPTSLDFKSLNSLLSFLKTNLVTMQENLNTVASERESMIKKIANVLHPSVKISDDEAHNEVVRTWGLPSTAKAVLEDKNTILSDSISSKFLHHHQILQKIGGFDMKKGVELAGHRGYFLKGPGVLLNLALVNYGLNFLIKKGYIPVQPPYLLKKDIMEETAELKDFNETLYHIQSSSDTSDSTQVDNKNNKDDLYLIATSEQPLCALHRGETLQENELPIKYAGFSTCFRKEAGSHGKDTWGIFRVHQFEKVEQLCICTPDKSWEVFEELINTSEEFYQSLGIPYRIISIVSGALNDAAAKKYDLEAWFPGYNEFKELVSCSNCTDYQSRALGIHLGYKFITNQSRPFVHLLNGTLVASERCLCCILENYQTEEGVKVPEPLIPYVGTDFIKYIE